MEDRMQGMTYSWNKRCILDLSLERKILGVSPSGLGKWYSNLLIGEKGNNSF